METLFQHLSQVLTGNSPNFNRDFTTNHPIRPFQADQALVGKSLVTRSVARRGAEAGKAAPEDLSGCRGLSDGRPHPTKTPFDSKGRRRLTRELNSFFLSLNT